MSYIRHRQLFGSVSTALYLRATACYLLDRHRSGEIDASYAAYDEHPPDEPDKWGDLSSWRRVAGAS